MDSESEMITCLDFSMFHSRIDHEIESEEWEKMSKKVREACESHGYFILMYDENKIPKSLCENMFLGMKTLFDLPQEIKMKHTSVLPFSNYSCSNNPKVPHSESLGIDNLPIGDNALAFTNLMWSEGNPNFSETLKTMSTKMLELNSLVLKMIQDGYDLPKQYTLDIEELTSRSNFRLMKYKVSEINKDCEALVPHTDKNTLTILCANDVQGLEVLTRTNKWIPLEIPQGGFVVFVGDTLKAWSNGRIHAAKHRVKMCEEKERYSFGQFSVPKEKLKIKVPNELVDDNMYPLRYQSFNYEDYLDYFASTLKENSLDAFIGV